MDNTNLKLTVNVITYNHEKYIEQCLDSILDQKTTFDFIVRVFDDASTDKTQEILKRYKDKYPDKIELFLAEKNMGKADDGCLINPLRSYENIKTPYYIFIEGDDYCLGTSRFQKQVEILDNNPRFSCVCGRIKIYSQEKQKFFRSDFKYKKNVFTIKDAEQTNDFFHVQHSAKMVRTSAINIDKDYPSYYLFDITQKYELIQKGDICITDDFVSVYRLAMTNPSSIYASLGFTKQFEFLTKSIIPYNEYTNGRFEKNIMYNLLVESYTKYYQYFYLDNMLKGKTFKRHLKEFKYYFIPRFVLDIFNIPRDMGRLLKRLFKLNRKELY